MPRVSIIYTYQNGIQDNNSGTKGPRTDVRGAGGGPPSKETSASKVSMLRPRIGDIVQGEEEYCGYHALPPFPELLVSQGDLESTVRGDDAVVRYTRLVSSWADKTEEPPPARELETNFPGRRVATVD